MIGSIIHYDIADDEAKYPLGGIYGAILYEIPQEMSKALDASEFGSMFDMYHASLVFVKPPDFAAYGFTRRFRNEAIWGDLE